MVRVLAILVCMAEVSHAAVVGVAETWPDTSLRCWQQLDHSIGVPSDLNLVVSGGALELAPVIDPQSVQDPRWSFVADGSASSGNFVGSLYEVGASVLTFDFYSSVQATLTVSWINDANLIIYNAIFPLGAGGPGSKFSVPLDTDLFTPEPFSFSDDFDFLMKNTDYFWFTLDWHKDAPSPIFRIDNVVLLGAGAGYGPWIDAFGQPAESRYPGSDADSDGNSNADEYLADTLPYEESSRLLLIPGGTSKGCAWLSSTNCSYTLLRSTNLLTQAFGPVLSLQSGTGEAMGYAETEDLPQAFYLLKAERK